MTGQDEIKPIFKEDKESENIKVGLLTLHPQNPRSSYDAAKLKILADSIKANGMINPIIIDEYGYILSGNRRYLAVKEILKWEFIKCTVKVGLSEFSKKSILISSNLTQESINSWENRDIIAESYWNEFLNEYEPKTSRDTGVKSFSEIIGLSEQHARRIIEASKPENKHWVTMLREENLGARLIDTIVMFPFNNRSAVVKELIEYKKKNATATRDDIRAYVRSINRRMQLQKRQSIPIQSFKKLIFKIKRFSVDLNEDLLERLDKEQKKNLKETIDKNILSFYKKL